VNLFVESDDIGKEKLIWVGSPGTKQEFATSGIVRGPPLVHGSYMYFVAGAGVYRVNSANVVSASLGTLSTSSGYVSMAHSSSEILIVDGTEGKIYHLDPSTLAFTTIANWNDGAKGTLTLKPTSVVYLDGFFLVVNAGTTAHANNVGAFSNNGDGTKWDEADLFYVARYADALLGIQPARGDVWMVGELSTEPWYDSGDAAAPSSPTSPRHSHGARYPR
jgi:hypothetical protein